MTFSEKYTENSVQTGAID